MSGRWLRRTLIACLVGGIGIAVAAQTTWERDHGAGVKAAKAAHFGEAGALYERALTIWGKLLGEQSPGLSPDLSNLAICYQHQGQAKVAEALWKKALANDEKGLAS